MCYSRLDSHRLVKQLHCFRNPVGLIQNVTEVNLRHPASGIARDSCPIKRFDVGVHPALMRRKNEQCSAEEQSERGLQPGSPTFQSSGQQYDPTGARRDNSQASQVLPVISYERVDEEVNVEKAQRRQQQQNINEHSRQWRSRPSPQAAQNSQQHEQSERKQILPPDSRVNLPTRINKH